MKTKILWCSGVAAGVASLAFSMMFAGGCASTSPGKATNTPTRKPTSTPQPTSTPVPTPTPALPQAYMVNIGGQDAAGATALSDVLVAGLDSAGNVMTWQTAPTMPTPILTGGTLPITCAMWGVKVGTSSAPYFLYGHSGEPMGTSVQFTLYSAFAPVSTATVGPWTDATPTYNTSGTPVSCVWSNTVSDGDNVYTVESYSGMSYGYVGNVTAGQVTAWNEQSGSMLGFDWDNGAVVGANGYLFVVGGRDGGTTILSAIYRASYGTGTIGAFSNIGNFPITIRRHNHQVVAASVSGQTYMYCVGGYNGAAQISTVYYTTVSSTGTLGSWQTTTALPQPLSYCDVLTWANSNGNYIYALAGYDGSVGSSTVYKANINSNGTIASWVSQNTLPTERRMTATVIF